MQIGVQDFRAAEIQIENGKKTEFTQKVYSKKITVASNDVVFEEKLDMAQYNQNNRGNRTNLINTGNLEFTNSGKVKFNKDYAGTITTSKANIGEVTFVNIPNTYEVGAVNKRIKKLTFMGNHVHNLRKNIYAAQVNFDAGTYNVHTNPVTINGNAKINGSTFDLKCDLILNGDVEFSGNITFNITGGYSVFFQHNLPSVIAGTNRCSFCRCSISIIYF
ncbi:hypothetical protein [Candidatus Rickettsia kedanie]|uniref:Uncharacterized protein n=1 Tax=Candidatus Rickettsia kedanie TaxID=3115352 RepID=A0ABP9TTZ6_9RICK